MSSRDRPGVRPGQRFGDESTPESSPASIPESILKGAAMAGLRLAIPLEGGGSVSALAEAPATPRACYVFAHGAGAGMEHRFMVQVAELFSGRGIATLRYQFPYMEAGSRRPDRPAVAHATVRAAVAKAAELYPGLALFAGGKSFGGRMTSQAQAVSPLAGVRGLLLLGFPLHLPRKPSNERAQHLAAIDIPLLIVQGTRDEMADIERMRALATRLGAATRLLEITAADHAFHVPKRSGQTDDQVLAGMVEAAADWMAAILASSV